MSNRYETSHARMHVVLHAVFGEILNVLNGHVVIRY